MPNAPKRPCPRFPCRNYLPCNKHPRSISVTPARRIARQVYDSPEWRRLRKQVINEEPICTICGRAEATDADHIQPLSQRPDLAFERSNLRGACKSCNRKRVNMRA